jgi:steroid 5-alpha reductase family enzyme
LSDHQLRRFKSDPNNKGKVCQIGLWSYSRHPNYFCEWLIWVAYATAASASPYGWLGWVGVGLMFYFLNYVTGVPLAEAQSLLSRGDAYRAYQSTTSAFFPRLPKKG